MCIESACAAVALIPALLMASPDIEHWTTSNGARVYFVEARGLPMVDLRVVFDAGSARDGGKAGLASLTNGLLAEGAGEWSSEQIAARFEGVGANFGNDALRDMGLVTLRTLSDGPILDQSLDTLATLLVKPRFDKDVFERERSRMQVGLRMKLQSPGTVASRAFYKALYGDHPYASPSNGTEESIAALTRKDVAAFHQRYYVAANAVIAIVGDLDRKGAEQVAERLVKNLPKGKRAAALPKVPALTESKTIRINHSSSQTTVLIGQPGIRRGEADHFALYLANHVLGGSGLSSKLSDEIREKRGLTYSVYSYFSPMAESGPFQMGLKTKNEQRDEAIKLLRETLQTYLDKGASDKEFIASRKNITGGFPLRIDSNKKIIGYLAMIGFYGLPLDYLDTFNARIEALQREGVAQRFRARLNPERMVTVIVGGGVETE
ncbi:M16 family metallopeptidase [Candidatus Reidiella endopervernicosa]|uniref:M16 family metallopeptidase n=1 Tax=Candidatus Reidiella endopervernicosa TaxID=2738883 RepID=UPI001F46FC0F|nr:pitrilysin family protein [Candidatus Reidiella endopervernicosa]